MSEHERGLYDEGWRYDLVLGDYAPGELLDFYRRQIVRCGEPVLELACGSGRLTIPLAEEGVDITGLDIAPEMLRLAESKAATRGVRLTLERGDVRAFNLARKFRFIFFPANSLSHLLTREEIEACFARVRRHLTEDGRFLVDIFNPSLKLLAREPTVRYAVGEYDDPRGGGRTVVTEQVSYNAATQINRIRWFYRHEAANEETAVSFSMRCFFPQEIDALLAHNGYTIEQKYGAYDESGFISDSPKQLILCRA